MPRRSSSVERFRYWKLPILLLLATVFGSAGAFWLLNRPETVPNHENWPTAEARVVNYRIMNDAGPRRGSANYIRYWAEYRLRYEVNGKRYEMWTPTDIVSGTRAGATGEAAHDMSAARFLVHYDPAHPWNADATRQ